MLHVGFKFSKHYSNPCIHYKIHWKTNVIDVYIKNRSGIKFNTSVQQENNFYTSPLLRFLQDKPAFQNTAVALKRSLLVLPLQKLQK